MISFNSKYMRDLFKNRKISSYRYLVKQQTNQIKLKSINKNWILFCKVRVHLKEFKMFINKFRTKKYKIITKAMGFTTLTVRKKTNHSMDMTSKRIQIKKTSMITKKKGMTTTMRQWSGRLLKQMKKARLLMSSILSMVRQSQKKTKNKRTP